MEVEYVVSYNKSSRLHPGLPKSSSHTLWGSLWKDPPFLAFHLRRCLWVQTDTIQRFDRNISRFPWKHSMYGIHGIYIYLYIWLICMVNVGGTYTIHVSIWVSYFSMAVPYLTRPSQGNVENSWRCGPSTLDVAEIPPGGLTWELKKNRFWQRNCDKKIPD